MIELRHLRYFLSVAETRHFGRAAERLHIAQPPLSRQIRQLEQRLGVQLFERDQRKVELTDAGAMLMTEAGKLFEQLNEAIIRTQRAARGEIGDLRIGFISTADYSVLPPLLTAFSSRYPEVGLTLRELTSDAQLAELKQGRLDVGFIVPPADEPELQWQTLYNDTLIAVLPTGHALSHDLQPLPVAMLAGDNFILFPRPLAPALFDSITGYTGRAGFAPHIAQEAVQMQTIISLVSAHLGVAIVPACMRHLQRTGVVYRDLTPAPPLIETALIWHRQNRNATLAAFIESCCASVSSALSP
jgi:DNA-binding transcriptional LysR family regulator